MKRQELTIFVLFIAIGWINFVQAGTPVSCIAFHPDQPVAVWNGDQSIIVHSTQSNAQTKNVPVSMKRVRDLKFDPMGQWLAVAGGSPGEQGDLVVVNWKNGSTELHLEYEEEWLTSVSFTHDSKHLAIGSGDSDILIYRIEPDSFKLIHTDTFSGHAGSVMDTVFDPSGHWLVSTGSDRSVKIWDVLQGTLHRTYSHHTGIVFSVDLRSVTPGQETLPFYVATASADQTVRIWQPEIGRMVRIVRNHDTDLFSVAYHPSGNWLASGGKDGRIRYIDAHSDQIIKTKQSHKDWIYALAFSANGRLMASGDWLGKVIFHQVNSDGSQ
ncbi:MAG: WD40 repeat domain-containing protein [Verrucomicrobia bacterium]|nr:WD40 repeat domain-containing protein [Verrucomicrobiota bacterium]